jgi:Flp pilus assembly protein TadD
LAIADFNKAIELNPSYSEAYNNRGATYLNLKNIEKAKEDAKKAAELGNKELLNLLKENGYL